MARTRTRSPGIGVAAAFFSDDTRSQLPKQEDIVQHLSLEKIRPDPGQPRRLLPADLNVAMFNNALPPLLILDQLVKRANTDSQLINILSSLNELATDISVNGLISPITVYQTENQHTRYTIETGERRWWAHWWLVRQKKSQFQNIRALVVPPKSNRMRQLSENLRREGLTAIETSLGLASLILEIEGHEISSWYQDGQLVPNMLREVVERRIQRGVWPQVVEKLGYTTRYWKNYLDLLKLCDQALTMAHRHQLPERFLRELTRMEASQQLLAIQTHLSPTSITDVKPTDETILPENQAKNQEHKQTGSTESRVDSSIALVKQLKRWQRKLIWHNPDELVELQLTFSNSENRQVLLDLQSQLDKLLATLEDN